MLRGKSASGHYFSGVECNFRVFQGIFPGGKEYPGVFRVFQGLLATLRRPFDQQRTGAFQIKLKATFARAAQEFFHDHGDGSNYSNDNDGSDS